MSSTGVLESSISTPFTKLGDVGSVLNREQLSSSSVVIPDPSASSVGDVSSLSFSTSSSCSLDLVSSGSILPSKLTLTLTPRLNIVLKHIQEKADQEQRAKKEEEEQQERDQDEHDEHEREETTDKEEEKYRLIKTEDTQITDETSQKTSPRHVISLPIHETNETKEIKQVDSTTTTTTTPIEVSNDRGVERDKPVQDHEDLEVSTTTTTTTRLTDQLNMLSISTPHPK